MQAFPSGACIKPYMGCVQVPCCGASSHMTTTAKSILTPNCFYRFLGNYMVGRSPALLRQPIISASPSNC